jgi:HSP20 family molecular chaperone IbpA
MEGLSSPGPGAGAHSLDGGCTVMENFRSFADEIRGSAREFGKNMRDWGREFHAEAERRGWDDCFCHFRPGTDDFFPPYAFPRMNAYLTPDRSMVFEFVLAGFAEEDISVSFRGDFMILSARLDSAEPSDGARFFRQAWTPRDIEGQKYFLPADRFDHGGARAVFSNGLLRVTVPAKAREGETEEATGGIRIDIVKEGN